MAGVWSFLSNFNFPLPTALKHFLLIEVLNIIAPIRRLLIDERGHQIGNGKQFRNYSHCQLNVKAT